MHSRSNVAVQEALTLPPNIMDHPHSPLSRSWQAHALNSSIVLTYPATRYNFHPGIITVTHHRMEEKETPLRLLDLCRPLCVDSLLGFAERQQMGPPSSNLSNKDDKCVPPHPQVALQYLKQRPTENSPTPPAWRTQSSSCVRPYHSQILPRDSRVPCLMGSWLNDSDRAYLVSVSGYHAVAAAVEHTQNIVR